MNVCHRVLALVLATGILALSGGDLIGSDPGTFEFTAIGDGGEVAVRGTFDADLHANAITEQRALPRSGQRRAEPRIARPGAVP